MPASLSARKLAATERVQNRFPESVTLYLQAIEFARRANRTDDQTAALSDLSFSEVQIGELDSAEEHAREAVRLGSCLHSSIPPAWAEKRMTGLTALRMTQAEIEDAPWQLRPAPRFARLAYMPPAYA